MVILLGAAIVGFATLSVASATVNDAKGGMAQAASLVRPNNVNFGSLLLPSTEPGYFVEAPRLSTDVNIDINGPIGRVTVTQRFENPSDGWVEGVYVFPLPEMSAVDTLKMRVGNRLIEGVIKVREEARQIYEEAKREGRKAALLEQQRDNLFTNEVANIGPKETVVVQIEYQQTVRQDNGTYSVRFPMVVAPRYSPKPIIQMVDFNTEDGQGGFGVLDPVPDRETITAPMLDPLENAKINPVTLTVRLAAGFPLADVTSPYHRMTKRIQDSSTRILTLENGAVPADRDFVLRWSPDGEAPNAGLFYETVDDRKYILAFVTPPDLPQDSLPKIDREVIFVIDNSGSMAGESMNQAKRALEIAIERLAPADRFNVVRFDDTHEILFNSAQPADREYKRKAISFVSGLQAEGGTEMLPALELALQNSNEDDARIRQVIFITDGAIGNEQQLFDTISQRRGKSRVFTIGIGSAPNSYFMTRAAELGRGTFSHIGAIDEVKEKMGIFFTKLENPVMTGLSVRGIGDTISEATPDPLPDLYKGEPIVVTAIIDESSSQATGSLEFTGNFRGQRWSARMDVADAAKASGVAKVWARRKIASLEGGRSYGRDFASIDKSVEQIALTHHIVSSRTSLVAVDVEVTRPKDAPLDSRKMPLNLPAGWDADAWFDEPEQDPVPQQRKASLDRQRLQLVQMMAAAPTAEGARQLAKQNNAGLTLPQTATEADTKIQIGLLLLILSALSWLIYRMYRRTGEATQRSSRRQRRADFNRLP